MGKGQGVAHVEKMFKQNLVMLDSCTNEELDHPKPILFLRIDYYHPNGLLRGLEQAKHGSQSRGARGPN